MIETGINMIKEQQENKHDDQIKEEGQGAVNGGRYNNDPFRNIDLFKNSRFGEQAGHSHRRCFSEKGP